jgi:hypothetical protein
MKRQLITGILAIVLLASVGLVGVTSSVGVYDPWVDLDDNGKIDIFDVVRLAGAYSTSGEPFQAKAAIQFDSGWLDITDQCGQHFGVGHGLNSTNVLVDIQGKTTIDDNVHQRYLGGTGLHPGWSKTYGGSGYDCAYAVIRTVDGGYAVAGETDSSGGVLSDAWLVKTDVNGVLLWNRTYGSVGTDSAQAVVQTSDGGYALGGYTSSSGSGGFDVWLVKTDGNGVLQWSRTHGGSGGDLAYSVVQTSDGGYALAGMTTSFGAGGFDLWLVKTYTDGTFQWGVTYGGAGDDYAASLVQAADDGYALAGSTDSFGAGAQDVWFVKTDANGVKQWNRTYGGDSTDGASAVIRTADGGYALAGQTASLGAGMGDAWLIKTEADGTMQWGRTYGGYNGDDARGVVQTSDGGYALAGLTTSFGVGVGDAWLVKTDAEGIQQWSRTYGGPDYDMVFSVVPTADGGYALAGYTNSFGAGVYDAWLVKTEAEQGLMWVGSDPWTITLYRGATDLYWNFVRVRVWTIKDTS